MTSLLDEFKICSKIPQNVKINVKSFYVFKDCFSSQNILFMTKDDKVYGLGHNYCGTLGFGHNQEVKRYTKLKELSNQKISQFYNGWTHVLGRNDQNVLFSWGWNICGQLGRGYKSKVNECLKPGYINLPQNGIIEDICCGYYHTLLLLSNGLLYGWGRNSEGQLGLHYEKVIDSPTNLVINERFDLRFKYIYSTHFISFAITTNAILYSWGYNENGILGQGTVGDKSIPTIVNLFNVQKITSIESNSYFLTSEGFVYFCGKYEYKGKALIRKTPIKLNDQATIVHDLPRISGTYKECYSIRDGNSFYRLYQDQIEITDSNYQSIYEICAKLLGITPQMYNFSNEEKNERKDFRELLSLFLSSLKSNKFCRPSDESLRRVISVIGSGGFGTVSKCLDAEEKQFYAIKRIDTSNTQHVSKEDVMKEVLIMSKLKSCFVVDYKNSWHLNNYLFIKMEYCFDNLRNILTIKPIVFERIANEAMNSIEYYISCQIFRQITEALNYVHSLKPEPLIHRDLKPENILIGNSNNRCICKLADFGLSKFIETHSDYHTMIGATHRYRAPEIGSGRKYDTKVDIWSLGIIGLELFNLDNQADSKPNKMFSLTHIFNETIDKKLERCDHFIANKLLTPKRFQRISCEEILIQMNTWSLHKISIKHFRQMDAYRTKFQNYNLNYFYDLLNYNSIH